MIHSRDRRSASVPFVRPRRGSSRKRLSGRGRPTLRALTATCVALCAGPAGAVTVLPEGAWVLASIPANPAGKPVGELFEPALSSDGYPQSWVVYVYDTDTREYRDPGAQGRITQGDGFWIQQLVAESVAIDAVPGTRPASVLASPGCPVDEGCAHVRLPGSDGAFTWTLVGSPFDTALDPGAVRIVTSARDSVCVAGCTLEQATADGLVRPELYRYDTVARRYVDVTDAGTLGAGDGAWLGIESAAPATGMALLLPRPATSADELPPNPGEAGRETLQGVDRDGDGLRDDVQIGIDALDYTAPEEATARQSAMALQEVVSVGGGDATAVQQVGNTVATAAECLVETFGDGAADQLELHRIMVLDTDARAAAAREFDRLSVGQEFAADTSGDACE